MTAHARTQIRDALVTRVTGLTTTGANVFANRYFMFDDATLPGLRVYASSESVQGEYIGGRQNRRVEFTVEAVAKANSDLEDTLDQIALEIEVAIATEQTLGGLVMGGVRYEGIGEFQTTDDIEHPAGIWPLRFSAEYDTDAQTPNTIA